MTPQPITGFILNDEQNKPKAIIIGDKVYPVGIPLFGEDLAAAFNGGDCLPLIKSV